MPRPSLLALLVLVGACSADAAAEAPGPPPTAPATAPPSVPADVTDRVEAAYRRAWDVYADAVGRLDPARLPTAFAGPALTLRRGEVADLARRGEAIRVRVVHHLDVAMVDPGTALVTDALDNHMVRVDRRTGRPIEPDPDDVVVRATTLRQEDGTWLVTEIAALD